MCTIQHVSFLKSKFGELWSPAGNNFDLKEGQRSRSKSQHGVTWKGLSQGSCMPNINALSLIIQKIWVRLKFLCSTDGQREGRMRFNVPTLSQKRGKKTFRIIDLPSFMDTNFTSVNSEGKLLDNRLWKSPRDIHVCCQELFPLGVSNNF